MRDLYIDAEFRNISEPVLDLVCIVTYCKEDAKPKGWWLYQDPAKQQKLKDYLLETETTLICYSANAEARALLALKLDIFKFKWIDLMIGYRCATNDASEDRSSGLIDACDHFCIPYAYTAEKEDIRNHIITAKSFSEEDKPRILAYCRADVMCMPPLASHIQTVLQELPFKFWKDGYRKIMTNWGIFSAACGKIESFGIPMDREAIKNLTNNYKPAKFYLIENSGTDCYYYDEKTHDYVFKRDVIQSYIANDPELVKVWPKTESGSYSLDKKDIRRMPLDSYLQKWWDVHSILNDLKFFNPEKSSYLSSLGLDDRMRTYFNMFGTLTSRNAPPAKTFVFAISRVFRSLVTPPEGYTIWAADWGQQEFILGATMSKDAAMIKAYASGDPYLGFAKIAKAVPEDATKKSHGAVRDLFKSTVLGVGYGMGVNSLHLKLIADTGKKIKKTQATQLLDTYKNTFFTYWAYRKMIMAAGKRGDYLHLKDGWTLRTGNPERARTYGNFPVQGNGGVLMRKAVLNALQAGLEVICPLHDAIYIITKSDDTESVKTLIACMDKAVQFYFPGLIIRTDVSEHKHGDTWIEKGASEKYELLKPFFSAGLNVELKNHLGFESYNLFPEK